MEWLADTNNFGDTRDPAGLAGPTGLVIILLLAVATIFLIRSMNSRLRKLPERFPTEPTGPASPPIIEADRTPEDVK